MKRKIGKLLLGILLLAGGCVQASAQEYTGITGMMHVPTAEMAPTGTARVGAFFLNGEFTPTKLAYKDDKYHTFNHFLAIAPFSWVELSYVCTLLKTAKNLDELQGVGFYEKDRHFCVKLRPLKEGKYWPALAIGAQDPTRTIEAPGHSGTRTGCSSDVPLLPFGLQCQVAGSGRRNHLPAGLCPEQPGDVGIYGG